MQTGTKTMKNYNKLAHFVTPKPFNCQLLISG